ncbi:MAG: endonuclease/exonuclease/phosphatase family protein [Clostridia bacterium]|nr:endonuclease/exonuclease/phosphatase family protein [Clostridia bacterium]
MSNTTLKVGTYNLQHGVLHRLRLTTGEVKVDLSEVTAVLREHAPDICALNEIYGNEESTFGNQPRVLGEALGYPYRAFARGIYHKYGEYGNGLLSKFPITAARTVPLCIKETDRVAGARHYEDRALLVANLDVHGQALTVMVCHFGLNEDEKTIAVDTVLEEAARTDTPLLLMGDFNITPDTVHYRRLAAAFSDTAAHAKDGQLSFPSHAPTHKIDYIFVRGAITPTRAFAPRVVASDHLPLFAEVTL